ncbi:Cu(I)-responsive transcriptional regulator [Propylenella binzhouense]|uniref:Cu(I)-responsive transcriptional regulator n=1 Tax=Propylenella binzhouense TaxID=2555902 RepID=A0A964WT55_9HYPH|nr:Cu(I)-responsive transcriptional regulator [Propylenella binzhouense]MYZ47495.1 Cu(I)-responsive transcriptional regulator [Propylenella binzhouense]
MNIGQASRRSGLPAKTIRYYEEIGLVQPSRLENGYRDYSAGELDALRFLARARSLGFSIEECRRLLSLYSDKSRASADVRRLAEAHIVEVDAKIAELQAIRAALARLVSACHGDHAPDCPILDELAGSAA